MTPEDALKLRAPFERAQIGQLPKSTKKDNPKGNCRDCGKYHGLPAVHLDYVGHAAVTDRLLHVDPEWSWEPVAFDPSGAPLIDKTSDNWSMWIRMTVCGVTRIGVGTVEGGKFEFEKQLISDAIRNTAMRFGVALDLWSKEDLDSGPEPEPQPPHRDPLVEGWESDATWQESVRRLTGNIKAQTPEIQEEMRKYRDDELKVVWPPSYSEWKAMNNYLEGLTSLPMQPPAELTAFESLKEAFPGSEDVTPAKTDQIQAIADYMAKLDQGARRKVKAFLKEQGWSDVTTELTGLQANQVLDFIETL